MAVRLTAGQAGDNPQLLPLLDEVSVARSGPGRPRQRPDRVVADKAYSHPSTRQALRRRGIRVVIPNAATRSPTAPARVEPVGALPTSTPTSTETATSSSERSTGSKAGAASPPDTTSTPETIEPV
jgi:transposase